MDSVSEAKREATAWKIDQKPFQPPKPLNLAEMDLELFSSMLNSISDKHDVAMYLQ